MKKRMKRAGAAFVEAFIEMLIGLPDLLDALSRRESLHYTELRMMGYDPDKIYKGFSNLQNRKILERRADGSIRFTTAGTKWLRFSYLRHARRIYPKWDRKWRLVIFDVPQEMHRARNNLRNKLKSLGFVMVQKSIFAFPYPCEEELGDICKQFEITSYVDVLTAENLGSREEEIKKFYNL